MWAWRMAPWTAPCLTQRLCPSTRLPQPSGLGSQEVARPLMTLPPWHLAWASAVCPRAQQPAHDPAPSLGPLLKPYPLTHPSGGPGLPSSSLPSTGIAATQLGWVRPALTEA